MHGKVQTPMKVRPPVNQPFEVLALDLVGLLPPGKGGSRSVITCAC